MRQRAAGVMGAALAFTNFSTEHRLTSGNVRSVVPCVLTLIVSADSEIRWPVQAFIFSVIAYFMIHFEFDAGQFFFFWLVMCLSCLTLAYLGMVVVCITPNLEMGITLGATLLGMWFAFAGFLIPRPLMPEVRNAVAVSAVPSHPCKAKSMFHVGWLALAIYPRGDGVLTPAWQHGTMQVHG
jgi:ABC-2 type transporter